MKLSIIIPVYNEERTINELLNTVKSIHLPKNLEKEIIVVDDGSTDNTEKALSKFKLPFGDPNSKLKILKHEKNKGKGAAVRTGISHAVGELIVIQDADLEYNPANYSILLEPILQKKAEVVYGTRLVDYPLQFWGKGKTVLPFHLIANKFLTFLTNVLYGSHLTDMETGYKLFRTNTLKKISITANGFEFEPEVTLKLLKLKIPIVEVPIKVTPRTYKEGKKISWVDGVWAIWTLFKYRFVD